MFAKYSLPRSSYASRSEFDTSDLRYPLYFFGTVSDLEISQELGKLGLKYQRQTSDWNFIIINFLNDNYFSVFLALVCLILLIVLIVANFKRLRASNIAYLEGVSNFHDALRYFYKDQLLFLLSFFFGGFFLLVAMFCLNVMGIFWISAYFGLILVFAEIAVSLLAMLVQAISHTTKTLLPTIKGNNKSTLVFSISICCKMVTELSVIVTICMLISQITASNSLKAQLSKWQHVGNYYSPYFSPYGLGSTEQSDEDKSAYQLAKWSQNNRGIIASYGAFNSANNQAATDYEDITSGNVILANAEYLKRNKIVSINGQRISLPNGGKTSYFLFPEKLKLQVNQLSQNYLDQLGINNIIKYDGRKIDSKQMLIQNHQRAFTYNTQGFDLGIYDGYAHEPVIIVISPESLGGNNDDADRYWDSLISN